MHMIHDQNKLPEILCCCGEDVTTNPGATSPSEGNLSCLSVCKDF